LSRTETGGTTMPFSRASVLRTPVTRASSSPPVLASASREQAVADLDRKDIDVDELAHVLGRRPEGAGAETPAAAASAACRLPPALTGCRAHP
jgi:hypothetical protein